MENISSLIAAEIPPVADRLNRALNSFQITKGRNPYPERTISYFYVETIRRALGKGEVFLEIPIPSPDNSHRAHLDALVFNEEIAVLCEFKRAWSPDHWNWLAEDVGRVQSYLIEDISNRFKSPKKFFGFFGADCWWKDVAIAWLDSELSYKNWRIPDCFKMMQRDFHTVYSERGEDYDGYYLTWAVSELEGHGR